MLQVEQLFNFETKSSDNELLSEDKYHESCRTSVAKAWSQLSANPILKFTRVTTLTYNYERLEMDDHAVNYTSDELFKSFLVSHAPETVSLSAPQFDVFWDFVYSHQNDNRYLLMPILYHDNHERKDAPGHVGSLIIDNISQKIYCFDSNGTTDTYVTGETSYVPHALDYLFMQYFEPSGWQYVPQCELSSSQKLNFSYYLPDDRGNCVAWTIFFGLVLRLDSSLEPPELYKDWASLPKAERGRLIYQFIDYLVDNVDKDRD